MTVLKTIPLIIIGIVLIMMHRDDFFKNKRYFLSLVIVQILITTGFNIFNFYRLRIDEKGTDTFWLLNARYTQFLSLFFVDILLIAVFMLTLLSFRQAELQILIKLGVCKNVENMTDKEMFSEYDKLKKQSVKLQKRLRKANTLTQ